MSVAGTAVGTAPPSAGGGRVRVALGTAAVLAGVAALVVAPFVPWLSLLHAQQTVNGVGGDPSYLAAAALGVGALWTAFLLGGRPRALRALAAVAALVILYWALFEIEHIVHMVIDDPMASVMGWPTMGPGPLLTATGGVVLLGATLSVPPGAGRVARNDWARIALGAALLAGGAVHLQQAPEHLTSGVLGAGTQLALGAAVLVRGGRLLYAAIVLDCAALAGASVHATARGEPATLSVAVAAAAAVAAVILAAVLSLQRRPADR
ncbi:MAG TPA: hypothetical protein VOB72_20035 [Candidatus Dormibacteraeota bacterium]|nr:hypothetical protein [Candidatus Dormibacteraeota bacterium]